MATILVVDDRPANREFLVSLLGYKGHRMLVAADGRAALALVRSEHPDVVICDVLMPTMDGYEFVRQLRAEREIAATKVIFYTAHFLEREARDLAQAAGVSEVLIKPSEPQAVLLAIERALELAPRPAPVASEAGFDREHLRLITNKLAHKNDELRAANQRLCALIDFNLQLVSQRDPCRLVEEACLSRRLVEVQESERRDLSRELHDRVGQNLTALGINLDILRSEVPNGSRDDLRSRLEDSIALVESTADAIENVMSELRPPMLDDNGLLPTLQWYGEAFSRRTGVEVAVRGDEPKRRAGQEVEITLFRIAQEALNNVAKHARATRVSIDLDRGGAECILSVGDDGIGFDPSLEAGPRQGRGLGTMRERVQAVGGRFEVSSMPGRGTEIVVSVPW